jgi:putative ABC transport system permease protein
VRPSSVIHLYRVRLRSRVVQELLAIFGIAVGVALIFSALVANTSLTSSVRTLNEGIVGKAGLQLTARGPDGFPQSVAERVRAIDGVEEAAPVAEVRANLVGPDGRRSVLLLGGDPRFAGLGGRLVRPFSRSQPLGRIGDQEVIALPAPIASDLGIAVAVPFRIEADTREVAVPLAIPLHREEIGALVDSPIAVGPLPYVQRIGGLEGRLTRVFVKPRPGREAAVRPELERIAGDRLNVRSAHADVAAFERAAYPTKQSTALFSGLSALVGFLFAFSSVLLTVPQRRRLIADLRVAGHEPVSLLQLLLFDALMLGVAGSVLGLAIGDQVARHLFADVPDYLAFTFSIGPHRVVTWEAVALSGLAGIAAACIAVLVPLRDVFTRHPLASRRAITACRARGPVAITGMASLAVATAVIAFAPERAMVGLVALTLALLLLLPLLLRLATGAFERLTRSMSTPVPILAVLELRSGSAQVRTLAVAATGALALFATVAVAGARGDLQRGLDESTRDTVGNADLWVTFDDAPNVLATTAFDGRRLAERLRKVEDVREVAAYRGGLMDVGDHRAWVVAQPPSAPRPVPTSQILKGDAGLAAERMRSGGWVVLSKSIAEEKGAGVGDVVRLPSPRPLPLRVAAISTNLGWSPGAIVLNADDHARAWGTEAASALHVQVERGVAPEAVEPAIERALAGVPGLKVQTRDERLDVHYAASRDGLGRLTQISMLVLIAAALAMATAMGGLIWQRRPAIAALKVHGYPESELWRALLLESSLLLGTGCSIGALFGLYGQVLLSRALATITAFPISYSTAMVPAAAILALVTAIAVAMLALPGWLAVRVRPAPGVST